MQTAASNETAHLLRKLHHTNGILETPPAVGVVHSCTKPNVQCCVKVHATSVSILSSQRAGRQYLRAPSFVARAGQGQVDTQTPPGLAPSATHRYHLKRSARVPCKTPLELKCPTHQMQRMKHYTASEKMQFLYMVQQVEQHNTAGRRPQRSCKYFNANYVQSKARKQVCETVQDNANYMYNVRS